MHVEDAEWGMGDIVALMQNEENEMIGTYDF